MAVCRWLWYWERNIQHSDWLIAKVFISDRPQPTINLLVFKNSLQPENFARLSTQSNLYLAMNCSVLMFIPTRTQHIILFNLDQILKPYWIYQLLFKRFQMIIFQKADGENICHGGTFRHFFALELCYRFTTEQFKTFQDIDVDIDSINENKNMKITIT